MRAHARASPTAEREAKRGVATPCLGGGEAVARLVEQP
jgi:hypothetical protein